MFTRANDTKKHLKELKIHVLKSLLTIFCKIIYEFINQASIRFNEAILKSQSSMDYFNVHKSQNDNQRKTALRKMKVSWLDFACRWIMKGETRDKDAE